jgi:hypothetical protein
MRSRDTGKRIYGKESTTEGVVIHIKIPPTMYKNIVKEAKKRCMSKAGVVRECLEKLYA